MQIKYQLTRRDVAAAVRAWLVENHDVDSDDAEGTGPESNVRWLDGSPPQDEMVLEVIVERGRE